MSANGVLLFLGLIRYSFCFSPFSRHVSRRRQTVAASVSLWHGAVMRWRPNQLVGIGRRLRRARTLRRRGVHCRRRIAHLRGDVLLAAVTREAAER